MAGEEKFGYFRLGEGTEGENGSLSSGCGWLEVLYVWRWELVTDCSSFVCEKSGKVVKAGKAVIEVVGGGGGGQRRELNVLKRLRMSGALLILLWKCEDLVVFTSVEKDESKDWYLLGSEVVILCVFWMRTWLNLCKMMLFLCRVLQKTLSKLERVWKQVKCVKSFNKRVFVSRTAWMVWKIGSNESVIVC